MRTFATKQPTNQDATHQKPVRANPAPVVRSHSTGLTGSAMLQRKPGCACGGGCPRCQESSLQSKLKISEPGDQYEQEADQVAEQVMAASAHSAVGGASPRIQRYAGQATEGMGIAPASVDRVLASSGSPLEPSLQQDMEQRFGHDFSRVRVHTGGAAEQSARDVNAHAYTVGHDIVFGAGRFIPGTNEGRRLLAHELTHVVQQSGADGIRAGQGNGKGGFAPLSPISHTDVQRQTEDDNQAQPTPDIRQDKDSISQTQRDYEPCPSLIDSKDFSILIANHYLSTELSFWTNPIFSSVDCISDYICFVNYEINKVNTTIRVELDSLPRSPGSIVSAVLDEPHSRECMYRYTCPGGKKVVFTKLRCFKW